MGEAKELLALFVLVLTYLGLGVGHLPGYRMNRAGIALVGAAFLILLGVLDLETAWRALDPDALVFLFGVMVLNAQLSYAGFFPWATLGLLRMARSPFALLVLLTFGTGLLSAFFLNDTMALLLTPLVLELTRALTLRPLPYLLALAGATNLGSVATLTGNPQNILVGAVSGIPYLDFARALAPVALVGLALQVGLIALLFPETRSLAPLPAFSVPRFRLHQGMLAKGLGVAAALFLAFLLGYPLAQGALVAAGAVLFTRRLRSERFFVRVDWELLVMFSGLFMVTQGVRVLGLLDPIRPWAETPLGLLLSTALLSNLVSNVPAVLLLSPLVEDQKAWLLLAAASTLAGNLTLLGSVANLIVAEAARRAGEGLTVWDHLRFGLPLSLLTLAFAYLWLS
ncbi:MAG: anion transporter [Thermus sp.]|uniref:SLC13 family permease n=1 Tax=Thermus sp. TaxID=275 RepID=UPI00331CD590